MKVPLPKGKYVKGVSIDDSGLDIVFAPKKKIALLFISINTRYWPYLKQVIEDCKIQFMPHHNVEYLVWSDVPEPGSPEYQAITYTEWWNQKQLTDTADYLYTTPGISVYPTERIEWPAPTLMRYHLFLQQEEKLKDYDYVFYMDADMRVLQKISDEIMGPELTAAPHPGYAVNSKLIPPYEPNAESQAYIPRLGSVALDEAGKARFIPFYAAGGFQGGTTKSFIRAMKVMKERVDKDFNHNYIAIWNDESHWNRYLFEFQQKKGNITFLDVSYVYPDSLIKEYYEPLWGRSFSPKIMTLTKPFSLSKQGGAELTDYLGIQNGTSFTCPQCKAVFDTPGFKVNRVVQCPGNGKPHQLDMTKL